MDDDVLLMRTDVDLAQFHEVDIDGTIAALSRIAQSRLPADLTLHDPTTAEAVELVLRRDGAQAPEGAEDGGRDVAHADPMGTYVDGVLQPPGTALRFEVPKVPSVAPEARDGLTDPGLDARTGGNLSLNTATILDDHGHATALAVKGNAYTTDAILQVNVLMSRAEVSVAGEMLMRSIVTNGNEAHNTARIADHDTSGLVKHLTFGSLAQVDLIDGDFYGVNVLRQVNVLSDNDVTVQGNIGAYYAVRAGENLESNSFRLSEIGARYDLIVVDGNYHSTNLIHQTNVLLNDDAVLAYTARQDNGSQSISTGDNILVNKAAIDRYGSDGFHPLSATLGDALDEIQDGILPPEMAATFPSHGQTLNILHVTGDFYDINVIQQTNLVSDVDGIVQHAASAGSAPTGRPSRPPRPRRSNRAATTSSISPASPMWARPPTSSSSGVIITIPPSSFRRTSSRNRRRLRLATRTISCRRSWRSRGWPRAFRSSLPARARSRPTATCSRISSTGCCRRRPSVSEQPR
ncbi:hypothetical protein GCM10025880_32560 [Methylorubrum aminovorans]|uniref:hypothetical protein n=1 Tax=Methylorubrum aminovorans TaxID=269069 RepID=UPI0023E90493|nr:hypothetical protein [Methylorubrum aminovorans]GMA76839.1 hypothetical protein GCM10025880_32560 [Methylorubrum aminovorans]